MSLLSATQGTAERVWSLLGVLSAHGGELARQDALIWLDPDGKSASAAEQTLQATSSLGFLETRGDVLCLSMPKPLSNISDFADMVHDRLASLPDGHADAVMLEAMAWLVASSERHGGTLWIQQRSNAELADEIDAGLPSQEQNNGERRFNPTKYPFWRRWMEFVGLGFDSDLLDFYPAVAERLRRELRTWQGGATVKAGPFLAKLAQRMPYMDGGTLFEAAATRLNLTRTSSRLTRILSGALRELHDDGVLGLETIGDARGAIVLADDSHPIKTFLTVRIGTGQE